MSDDEPESGDDTDSQEGEDDGDEDMEDTAASWGVDQPGGEESTDDDDGIFARDAYYCPASMEMMDAALARNAELQKGTLTTISP